MKSLLQKLAAKLSGSFLDDAQLTCAFVTPSQIQIFVTETPTDWTPLVNELTPPPLTIETFSHLRMVVWHV